MKYTYFANVKGGKYFIRSLFQYNNKSSAFLSPGYSVFTIITKPTGNGYHSYEWNWEDKFSHELKTWYEVRHLETLDEVLYQKSEQNCRYFVDKNTFARHPINLYKTFPRAYEVDLVVNPLLSLGYSNWNLKMKKLPTGDIFEPTMNTDLDFVIKELQSRRNIVAYKENEYDWIHKFFLEGNYKVLEEEGEDVYVNYITNHINRARMFQKYLKNTLEYYKIPYETFSLDTGDYCKTFGLSKSIDISLHDNRFTKPPFLSNILREKSKTWTENYLAKV